MLARKAGYKELSTWFDKLVGLGSAEIHKVFKEKIDAQRLKEEDEELAEFNRLYSEKYDNLSAVECSHEKKLEIEDWLQAIRKNMVDDQKLKLDNRVKDRTCQKSILPMKTLKSQTERAERLDKLLFSLNLPWNERRSCLENISHYPEETEDDKICAELSAAKEAETDK